MQAGDNLASDLIELPEDLEFTVNVEPAGSAAVVAVTGELDVHTVPALREALAAALDAGASALVVDLIKVGFVDSVGLGAILHTKKRLGPGQLAVVLAPGSYAEVIFDVVGADSVVDVYRSREQAVAQLAT